MRRVSRPRILYVHSRKASFVAIDRAILAERYEVEDWYQPGHWGNLPRLIGAVRRADLVFGWFASWHTFFPITLAWLMRKPSVQIVGGFDTANMPDIGFGYQQGGLRRWASRWIMKRAGRLVTNSYSSQREIAANTPIPPEDVTVIHHGVPDPFGPLDESRPRERLALTVGPIDAGTLIQKGHLPFVQAARQLPDVRFVFVGKPLDDAIERLRAEAGANVEFTGWLSDEELTDAVRARVGVRAALAPRGLRPGGDRGDAGRLRARGRGRDRDARGGGRGGGADRLPGPGGGRGRHRGGAGARARRAIARPGSACSTSSRWRCAARASWP